MGSQQGVSGSWFLCGLEAAVHHRGCWATDSEAVHHTLVEGADVLAEGGERWGRACPVGRASDGCVCFGGVVYPKADQSEEFTARVQQSVCVGSLHAGFGGELEGGPKAR